MGGRQVLDEVGAFQDSLASQRLSVDLVPLSEHGADLIAEARTRLGLASAGMTEVEIAGLQISFRTRQPDTSTGERLSTVRPFLCICLVADEDHMEEIADRSIALECEWLWLVHESGVRSPESLANRIAGPVLTENLELSDLGVGRLEELLGTPQGLARIALAHDLMVASTIQKLINLLEMILRREERAIRSKQVLIKQQVRNDDAKKEGVPTDALQHMRDAVNEHIGQLERGLNHRIERATRTNGALMEVLDSAVMEPMAFQRERRMKSIVRRIDPQWLQRYLQRLKAGFVAQGLGHLVHIKEAFQLLEEELKQIAARNNIDIAPLSPRLLSDGSLKEIVESTLHIERPYESAEGRKGVYEFFLAMRKYQMLVAMLISTVGLSLYKVMGTIMIPVSLLLLLLGVLLTWRSTRKERKESEATEVAKAREAMRAEGRRIASDFGRQWSRALTDHLRNQQSSILHGLEAELKERSTQIQAGTETERMRVQRISRSAETAERRISSSLRSTETLRRTLSRLASDLRSSFILQTRKKS